MAQLFNQADKSSHSNLLYLFPFILVFTEILAYLSMDMYIPALPVISQEFRVSQDVAQYTQVFWSLGSTSIQLFLGPIADLYGKKLVISLGVIVFIISSAICYSTDNIYLFILARFFQGSTVCAIIVAGYAKIHEMYTGKKSVQILAIMGSVTILAPALGPVLGALVITFSQWRNIFGLLTVLAIISFISISFFMPSDTRKLTASAELKLDNIYRNYKSIFINKDFIRFALINSFTIMCFFIWIIESPFIIIKHYAKSELYFGIVQSCVFGSYILGAQTARRLISKISAKKLCDLGLSIVACSIACLIIFSYFEFSIYLIISSMMGVAFGASTQSGLLNRLAIQSASEPMAQRVAVYSLMFSISATTGGYLVTLVNDMSFDNIAFLMAVCSGIAISIYLSIRDKVVIND